MPDLRKGVYILPNLFTTANLFLGFYAIISAVEVTLTGEGTFQVCAVAIILAALADMIDGRVANLTNSATRFGMEYDSLGDVVSFGVAPALVMFLWSLQSLGQIGWVACFLYLGCTAMRLARYNIQVTDVEKDHFQGLPSPMAAFMLCGLMLIFNGKQLEDERIRYIGEVKFYALGLVILLSLLMVSNVNYRSFKNLILRQRLPFFFLLLIFLGFMLFALKPLWTIFLIGLIYVLSGLVAIPFQYFSRRGKREPQAKPPD